VTLRMMTKRYYKVPIAPVEGAFGYDTGDRTTMGYWIAEFHGQETVRQLELHPRKPPVLMERGHPEICPHSLDDTNLVFKPHLEIFATEFEDEWHKAMLIAAAELEVETESQNGGAAVDPNREEESPDEPLPEIPQPTPSPDEDDTDSKPHGTSRLTPHRRAPLPPGRSESEVFNKFRAMLAEAAGGAGGSVKDVVTMWNNGAKVISSLRTASDFDEEHFTHFLYSEMLHLVEKST